jgi:hypothetical protein
MRRPSSSLPPPLPTQLAPWSPPVQGRPVTLPAFEAPITPPAQASPVLPAVQASPVVLPSVRANPFMPPVHTGPAETPVDSRAVEPPIHASSVVMPSVHAPPVHADPVAPMHADPVAAVHADSVVTATLLASPVAPAVHASLSERPAYVNPVVPPEEDVNPIVRPVVERRAHARPRRAQALVDAPAHTSSVLAEPVDEQPADTNNALAQPLLDEPAHVSPLAPVVVEATSEHEIAPPMPIAEAAPVDAAMEAGSAVEGPAVTAPMIDPARAEPAVVAEHASGEPAVVAEHASGEPAVARPAVAEDARGEHASGEARVPNAFETAPTEVASSETPITQTDTAAAGAAELSSVETPPPGSTESVIGESEIQERPAITQPYPAMAPPRSFTSSGSEMPVVITTPAPYRRDSSAPAGRWRDLGREYLPRAQAWSRKTLRATPRTLVIAAPIVALLGIWAIRSVASHPKQAEVAEANAQAAQPARPAPAPNVAASVTSPAAPSLVAENPTPSNAAPGPDAAELSSAITHGLPALEALAQKFPNDAQVGVALASQQAQAQRFEAAVASIEHLISVAPQSTQNGKVMGILWRAAQSSASERSFAALRKLGARGADIAFDLATTSGVRESVRERAKSELEKSLSADASADTRVASALLLAPDCAARKSLLARAEREGGKRTQAMLERISRGSACTSRTDPACNACLTGSPDLAHALAQLSSGGQK